jgi:hypothetical protein
MIAIFCLIFSTFFLSSLVGASN